MPKERKRSPDLSDRRVPSNAYYQSRRGQGVSPFDTAGPKKTGRKKLRRSLDIFLALVLIFGLINALLLSRNPKVTLNDSTYHVAGDYQSFLNRHLGGWADSNKVSFNQDRIIAQLKTAYPEVNAAAVELPVFSRRPVFRLEVAVPALFIKSSTGNFLVNSNGVAVGPEAKYKKLASLPEVEDQSGFEVNLGKQVLSSQDIQFIQAIAKEMKVYSVPVKAIALPSLAQQINVYTTDSGYYTKFYTGGDPSVQAAQMIAARQQFGGGGPSQYLDVRVSGKVFYK